MIRNEIYTEFDSNILISNLGLSIRDVEDCKSSSFRIHLQQCLITWQQNIDGELKTKLRTILEKSELNYLIGKVRHFGEIFSTLC